MNKNGFILVWAMVLILMIGISMTVATNSRDGSVIAYNKAKLYENAYHHAIAIEDWAKVYVREYDTNMEGWMNNSHQLHDKLVTNGDFIINGKVGDDDGRINLYGLIIESGQMRSIYEQIMVDVYGQEAHEKIYKIKNLLLAGRKVVGSGILGKHKGMFSDRILGKDIKTATLHNLPEANKTNINTLNKEVAKIIFGMDKDRFDNFKEQGPYKSIKEVVRYIDMKESYKNIIKFDSLFYYVDGSIIVGNNKTNFIIDLTKENDIIKTTYRYVQ